MARPGFLPSLLRRALPACLLLAACTDEPITHNNVPAGDQRAGGDSAGVSSPPSGDAEDGVGGVTEIPDPRQGVLSDQALERLSWIDANIQRYRG
jgi:hypothetical protein